MSNEQRILGNGHAQSRASPTHCVCGRIWPCIKAFGDEPPVFKRYNRRGWIEARPHVPGENLTGVSVNEVDHPEETPGGMIGRNPDNHRDQWYIAPDYFKRLYDHD